GRHEKVASIPAFSAGTDVAKIKSAADEGYFIMKLKLGSAGTQLEMLEKDKEFLSAVHKTLANYRTPYTRDGKIPYYLDPNGRYEEKDTYLRFLDPAKNAAAFDRFAVEEEPSAETKKVN